MQSTVLITGATGFIGQAVTKKLLQSGHNVRALVRSTSTWPFDSHERLKRCVGNMCDITSLVSACDDVDWICHLAAAKSDEKESREINVRGAENLCRAAAATSVRFIVNISTQSIKLKKRGRYAETKREADLLFQQSRVPVVTLCPSLVYGGPRSGAFQSVVRLSKLPIIPLFGNGKGTYYPIHRDDLAEIILRVSQHEECLGKSFEVGGTECVTLKELVHRVKEIQQSSSCIIPLPLAFGVLAARLCSLLPHPPISVSNVLGGGQETQFDPFPIHELCSFIPRRLSEVLIGEVAEIVSDLHNRKTPDEAACVLSYVLPIRTWKAGPEERERYHNALRAHGLDRFSSLSPIVCRHRFLLGALDAVTCIFYPQSPLRKKLIIAASLMECHPVSASVLLPCKRSVMHVIGLCMIVALRSLYALLIGIIFFLYPRFLRHNVGHI